MSVQGFDHYIKREIFSKLRQNESVRYSDLVIKTVEPSQFMYHLKELMRMGLVEKVEKGRYRLTKDGIRASQAFSSTKKNITVSPMTYTLIYARSNKGKWLVLERHKHPYINMYGCISGKVHIDEMLTDAFEREWKDFIGTSIPNRQFKGYASVLITDNDEVLTHIAGPVWFVDGIDEDWSEKEAVHGQLSWVNWQELDYDKFIPGWKEIVDQIESSNVPFLLDLSFSL
jgi:DNA-binding transcriptional ArsR family regulator